MISQEQVDMLQKMDPISMSTDQQCAYVLKCLEADMHPQQILESRFKGDSFSFDLIMTMLVSRGWAKRDKSGRWKVKR